MRTGTATLVVLLLLLASLAWRNVTDPDFGSHMAGGGWIAQHASVPQTDPFTFTASEHPYLAYHWLFQLGLHGIHHVAGVRGLVVVRALLLLATALLLADILRARRCSPLAAALVGLCAILATEWRFGMRPELASWLLAAAALWLLERHRLGRTAPLWLLPLLFILWVNLHVYAIGAAIVAIYASAESLRAGTLRTPLAIWSGIAFAAALLNPYGLDALTHPMLLATRLDPGNLFARHISELASPLAFAPDPAQPFSTGVQLGAYRLLLLLGCASFFLHLHRRRFEDAAVIAAFGTLSLLAVRNTALYAVVATPALCTALDDMMRWPESSARSRAQRALGQALLCGALGYALLCVPRVLSGAFYAEDRRPQRFSATLCRACLAVDSADWLAEQPIEGRGLNNLVIGGALAWRDPERKIFIDARNEVSGEALYADYLAAMDPQRWEVTQRRYGLEYVVLAHRDAPRARRLARALLADPGWKLVYLDASGAVFVRADGPNGGMPAVALPLPVGLEERHAALAGLAVDAGRSARARRWLSPSEAAPGEAYALGSFLLAADRLAEAERPLLAAAAASHTFWEPHFDLGVLYQRLGLPGPARQAFSNARSLAPDHPALVSAKARGGVR
jgi:hypothetical protein